MSRKDAVLLLVVATTIAAFSGIAGHAFLNWDDPDALVNNEPLEGAGVVAWAFSTTHMSHYQPLSWITWAAVRGVFGSSARVHHVLSIVSHALVAGLLFLVARALLDRVAGGTSARGRAGAVVAALFYALHPLRVEVVAWASAFPYVLSLTFLLLSFLFYWRAAVGPGPSESGEGGGAARWPLRLSLLAYAASLLARPIAFAFPLALLLVDRALGRAGRKSLLEKAPFALLAVVFALAEGQARAFAGMGRIGLGPRLTSALGAPFTYLARELLPFRLSPLDVQALEPRTDWLVILGAGLILAVATFSAVRASSRHPWPVAALGAWLLLLAPAVGLVPSGLAATADRYAYVPDVALALLVGGVAAAAWTRAGAGVAVVSCAMLGLLGVASHRQAGYWRDSVTLWTRAATLDPRNDVALYNLALAQIEAGDEEGAASRLRETLALVPDHQPARSALDAIELRGLEREAAKAAEGWRLDEAIELYSRVLAKDGARMRARASRGMALLQRGRLAEAAADLGEARRLGNDEPPVAGALALALHELGRPAEARDVLEAALRGHAQDVTLNHNLARLLATSADPAVRNAPRALELALEAQRLTEGRDPRVYDTLAAAYAASGQDARARETALEGSDLARSLGATELADTLAARARALK